jgi:hypothetical protein
MITLTTLDLFAVMIALVVSVTLVITTAIANYRLTESRNYWRYQYHELNNSLETALAELGGM